MDEALKKVKHDSFVEPEINDSDDLKPVIRGVWQGGESVFIDSISKRLATDLTPPETKKELVVGQVHSTLYWIDRDDPLGPIPGPQTNQQYINWETAVQNWWQKNKSNYTVVSEGEIPTTYDNVHTLANQPKVEIISPKADTPYDTNTPIEIDLDYETEYDVGGFDIFVNDVYVGSTESTPFNFSFIPKDIENLQATNELKVIVRDEVYNKGEATVNFEVDI